MWKAHSGRLYTLLLVLDILHATSYRLCTTAILLTKNEITNYFPVQQIIIIIYHLYPIREQLLCAL